MLMILIASALRFFASSFSYGGDSSRRLASAYEPSVIRSIGAVLCGSLPKVTGTLKLSLAATLEKAERVHILQTLEKTEGVVGRPEWRSRPAGRAADDFARQDEAAGFKWAKNSTKCATIPRFLA
jgi:hypothetical protein